MRCLAKVLAAALCFHLSPVPASALGDTEVKNCAIEIAGSVDASQVLNVCGVPAELLAAIVEEFDQAKNTLQELADERRTTVENVRQALDLTNGQIRAAFEILGETNIPSEQLASKLVEIAKRFKELQSIAAAQPGDTPEIIALKEQVEAATKAGELDRADALLAEIDGKAQAETQDSLAANRATTLASRGELALGRLRYRDAAKYVATAAATLPPGGTLLCGATTSRGRLLRCISKGSNTATTRHWKRRWNSIGTCWNRHLDHRCRWTGRRRSTASAVPFSLSAFVKAARRVSRRDGRRLSRCAGGADPRARSARLGGYAKRSRRCALGAWRP